MAGRLSRIKGPWLIAIVVAVLAAGGYILWRYLVPRETTDDAQVSGHVQPVAARVAGPIQAIHVQDNQVVKAGDVLVEIDPRDYELALQKAEADLSAAQAAARAAQTGVPIASTTTSSTLTSAEAGASHAAAALDAAARDVDASAAKITAARARVDEAQANAERAAQDLARLKPLLDKDEVPRQQYDAAVAADRAAQAAVGTAQATVAETEANLRASQARQQQAQNVLEQARAQAQAAGTAPQQVALSKAQAAAAEAQVQQAQAAVDQARLNLERTTVRAASDGVVGHKIAEVGQIVQPGQPLMAITSLGDVWITANFKETQLDAMRAGQHAVVSIDGLGGRDLDGHVDSIAAATGATFSLLPPENASGNFVKVVQRVPVKIVLDAIPEGAVLRPGMSVTATVYVK